MSYLPAKVDVRNLDQRNQMRYFTYDLLVAANDWNQKGVAARRRAEARFDTVTKKYYKQLDSLESRMSKSAWQFFRYGYGKDSLHDARLLSLRIGDGLDYVADGKQPFLLNYQHTSLIIEFLNYEQDALYTFDLRKVEQLKCDLFGEQELLAKSIGDLYIYEMTAVGDNLQLGFLFATGASIVARFSKLVFRKKRIKRSYEASEMYR